MKLEFYGAAGCVTGSCHILKVNGKTILLDCGLYQGKDENEIGNEGFNFNPKDIDYVVLSHAHIDHSGRIPLLYKKGFKGQVLCTEATLDLCSVMLPDSGHIQENEVEWKNRKRVRQGLKTIEPIYTAKMAELSMYLFRGVPYESTITLFEGFKVRFKDAGHLLGSAFVEMFITEESKDEIKLVYTGDVGNKNIPIIKDPAKIDYADYLIMESTYGDRLHTNADTQFEELAVIIKDTFARGGNVIIPSFAVGRAQEIIYELDKYVDKKIFDELTVYVDSPLATESTKIFEKNIDCYDEEAKEKISKGDNPLKFKGLVFTNSPEESAQINKIQSGVVVISASGMCEAGRIKHHLKHNLWRSESSIVFIGYQAEGTLGRAILNGAKKVKLFGDEVVVNAKIYSLQGLSGHADRQGLINWLGDFVKKPSDVFLVHGEKEAEESLKKALTEKSYNARIMQVGDVVYINEKPKDKVQGSNSKIKDDIIRLLDSIDNIEDMNKDLLIGKIKDVIKNV